MLDSCWTLKLDLGWSLKFMLDSCWTHVGLCLAISVGNRNRHFDMCWTHVGLVLDSCWTRVGLGLTYFRYNFCVNSSIHVGLMLDSCWTDVGLR